MNRYDVIFDSLHRVFLVRRRILGVFWRAVFRTEIYYCARAFQRELERSLPPRFFLVEWPNSSYHQR